MGRVDGDTTDQRLDLLPDPHQLFLDPRPLPVGGDYPPFLQLVGQVVEAAEVFVHRAECSTAHTRTMGVFA